MMNHPAHPLRQANRFAASLPARLHLEGRDHPCSALNLSRSGMLLIGDLPQPEAGELEVTIETPGGDLRLRARIRLVRAERDESTGERRLGVEFVALDEQQSDVLERLVARVMEGMAPAALEGIEPGMGPERIRIALAAVPHAHRVALAFRGQKTVRDVLRHDRDGQVLEALARNPQLTAPEAIALARLPHLLPTTLAVMAEDERWARNEELRVTIATHPRTPFATADQIVSHMGALAVQRVLRRPGLNPGVREKLMMRLSRKHRGSS